MIEALQAGTEKRSISLEGVYFSIAMLRISRVMLGLAWSQS